MKRHCGVGAATLVGVFLFAVSALAAQVSFTPRVSVTEEYNDNVDLDRKGKKDDFITTVSPGATLEVLGPLSGIRLSYDPSYSFYADNDEFDSWRHNASGFIWHNFSRETRIDLADSFLYSKDPLDARDVEDERGNIIARGDDRLRRRSTFYRNVALGRLSLALPALMVINLGLVAWLNTLVVRQIALSLGWPSDEAPLSGWAAPEWLIFPFLAAGFAMLVPVPGVSLAAFNLFLILGFVYFGQGVAVLAATLQRLRAPLLLRGVGYFLIFMNPLLMLLVMLLGLLDLWLDFRRLGKPREA